MKPATKLWAARTGIPFGVALGAIAGSATGNLALGISFGLVTGSLVGLLAEAGEKRRRGRLMAGVAVLALVVMTTVTILA